MSRYSDVECPYCGEGVEICHDDGYGYEEDRVYEQECPHCDKAFAYTTTVHFNYTARKADCLNGAEHDWRPLTTNPVEFTRMACQACDERRWPTEAEMSAILEARAAR